MMVLHFMRLHFSFSVCFHHVPSICMGICQHHHQRDKRVITQTIAVNQDIGAAFTERQELLLCPTVLLWECPSAATGLWPRAQV